MNPLQTNDPALPNADVTILDPGDRAPIETDHRATILAMCADLAARWDAGATIRLVGVDPEERWDRCYCGRPVDPAPEAAAPAAGG